MRGSSAPILALVSSTIILALAVYSLYMILNTVITLQVAQRRGVYTACEGLRIVNATLVSGSKVNVTIVNEGVGALTDLSGMEIVVVLKTGDGSEYSYVLRLCRTLTPGCWTPIKIVAGSMGYSYDEHRYLRPGEYVYITGLLPGSVSNISYGYIVSFTSCSRAERILTIV
ncbi:MAG: hypothetical protein JHC33_09260 [Ignisphaera sp.]|nr:hypothetical protein [Ignisphaera sp.]